MTKCIIKLILEVVLLIDYICGRIKGIIPNIYYVFLILFWPSKLKDLRRKEYLKNIKKEDYEQCKEYWDKSADQSTESIEVFRYTMIWSMIKMGVAMCLAYGSVKVIRGCVINQELINYIRLIGVCFIFTGVSGKVGAVGVQTFGNASISERANNAWNRYLYFLGIYISLVTSMLLL